MESTQYRPANVLYASPKHSYYAGVSPARQTSERTTSQRLTPSKEVGQLIQSFLPSWKEVKSRKFWCRWEVICASLVSSLSYTSLRQFLILNREMCLVAHHPGRDGADYNISQANRRRAHSGHQTATKVGISCLGCSLVFLIPASFSMKVGWLVPIAVLVGISFPPVRRLFIVA